MAKNVEGFGSPARGTPISHPHFPWISCTAAVTPGIVRAVEKWRRCVCVCVCLVCASVHLWSFHREKEYIPKGEAADIFQGECCGVVVVADSHTTSSTNARKTSSVIGLRLPPPLSPLAEDRRGVHATCPPPRE